MDFIIKIILAISGVFVNIIFFSIYFSPKEKLKKLKIICIVLVFAIGGSVLNISIRSSFLNLTITIITLFAICFTLFYGNIMKKILLSIIYLLFILLLELVISFFTAYFVNESLINLIDDQKVPILSLMFSTFVEFVIILSLKNSRKINDISGEKSIYLKQIIIPLLSVISVFLLINIQLISGKINYPITIYIIVFLVIINIVQYHIYEKLETLYQKNYEVMIIAQNLKNRDEYYTNLEICQEEIRKIKHDLKHELLVLKGYLTLKQYGYVIEYIDMLINDVAIKEEVLFTQNIAINILLSTKYSECMKKDIKCNFDIKIPKTHHFDDKDVVKLLGNVLDNSIEACDKCHPENRYINLLIIFNSGAFILEIINSTDGKVKDLTTRKLNVKEHGFGIESILAIVDKYHGDIEFVIKDFYFKVQLNLWE